jgi:peroxiredoxin
VSPTIEQQTREFQASVATRLPPDVSEVFNEEQQRWRQADPPKGAVQPGDVLESLSSLLDAEGNALALSELWAEGPLVVVFYRGGWCPYCNIALRTYQKDLLPELSGLGARLVAISPQTPDQSLSTKEKAELDFTVLSDPGNACARRMGITFQPADEILQVQRTIGLDLSQVNADGSTELPMPTVLVIDSSGTVRFVDIHPDYTSRTEVPVILEALRTLD